MSYDNRYFDKNYFTKGGDRGWYNEWAFSLENPFHKKWVEFLIDNIPMTSGNILDIGTARGNVVYWFDQKGFNSYGTDISTWAVENAHHSHVVECDITKGLPFKDSFFNYIITRETLEHIYESEINMVISDIHRTLKSFGLAVISVATNRGGKEDAKQDDDVNSDESHVLIKSPFWWIKKFEEFNLVPQHRDYIRISTEDWPLINNWDIMVFKKKN